MNEWKWHAEQEKKQQQPKQRCQLPSHANMRHTAHTKRPMMMITERSFRNLFIIIDCIIWTYDILINCFSCVSCACVICLFVFTKVWMSGNNGSKRKWFEWCEWGEEKIKETTSQKQQKNKKRKKQRTWNNRLINENWKNMKDFLQKSSRSRAIKPYFSWQIAWETWFGFIEILCKQKCKKDFKNPFGMAI